MRGKKGRYKEEIYCSVRERKGEGGSKGGERKEVEGKGEEDERRDRQRWREKETKEQKRQEIKR